MGQVFRATDTKLKRQVAIKILPPSLAADHDRLARFQREAEVLASLNHPHIAGIYGLEESDGVSALVMELVEGDLAREPDSGTTPCHAVTGAPRMSDEATQASASAAASGDSIGAYRLLQRIGEGGMGDVWLAEQTQPIHRQVALKVIKAGMDTAQVVARFEAERQALAVMDHPAIARVFDGGATPQGRPYFVMEYVRGESITTYCQRHKLSTRDRINLFLQVCDGVQHAHQKGIIHRDLKPSNILVTVQDDRPVPKIIDFGVAKATTQSPTERMLHTEFGALIGTPEYMSPEQAEMTGLDIDTRTDVRARCDPLRATHRGTALRRQDAAWKAAG